jgi:hypothetical protein
MKGELVLLLFAVFAILMAGAVIHGGRFRSSKKK